MATLAGSMASCSRRAAKAARASSRSPTPFGVGPGTASRAPEVEPQRGDSLGQQTLNDGDDDVVAHVAAVLGVRMADRDAAEGPAFVGQHELGFEDDVAVGDAERLGSHV